VLLLALALELTIVLALWLALSAWQRDEATPAGRTFLGLCLASALWCAGELVELRGLATGLGADRVAYVGILALPALWFALAAHAAELDLARRVPWLPLPLLAPQVLLYALLYAGPWGSIFLSNHADGSPDPGPLFWVTALYSWTLVVAGSALLIATALRGRRRSGGRRLALGLASLLPIAGNVAHVGSGFAFPIDPTPLLLGVTLLALRSAVLSGGLLQALPISQHDLVGQLPVAVVLTDRHGTVIDVNPAAERRLGVSERAARGRALDSVLEEADPPPHVEVTPVVASGREVGQLALVDPPRKPGSPPEPRS